MGINEQQRITITQASWMHAQKIVTEYWPAVDALATALLKHESLCRDAAHRLIWETMGYPDLDWRFEALNIQPKPGT
jgi:hypothetical protein